MLERKMTIKRKEEGGKKFCGRGKDM